jgi:DNA adenine methylase
LSCLRRSVPLDHWKAALIKIISRFDQPHTFCLDPPYYINELIYEREDADAFNQHEELAEALKQIKGKFLLSYNNDPYIKQLYKDCVIEEVETQY